MNPSARSFRAVLSIVSIILAAVVGLPLAAWAGQQLFPLAPGDQLTVTCDTRLSGRVRGQESTIECLSPTSTGATATPIPPTAVQPTAVPTSAVPTATPPHDHTGAVGICGESMDMWHPPVVNGPNGQPCATGHEHGDQPPSWIAQAGKQVMFHGHFNTSPAENTAKHAAMKGFTDRFNDVDIYFRIHAASNPLDRMARYHSYEVWARDPSGNVSHWQLWYNSGDPRSSAEGGSRVLRRASPLPAESQRPIILVLDEQSRREGIDCEQWYSAPGEPQWGWDFGWTICGATTLYSPTENATAADLNTWITTGSAGLTRRLEAAWYGDRQHPTGTFYSTQFGEIVSGPSDARCSGTTTKFGTSYQNVCLEQYIAPTLPTVAFPNNASQKDFDGSGVRLPN
jgi:hypothetical protein